MQLEELPDEVRFILLPFFFANGCFGKRDTALQKNAASEPNWIGDGS